MHPRDDLDRLYVSRKERGRGLASSEDSVASSEGSSENIDSKILKDMKNSQGV